MEMLARQKAEQLLSKENPNRRKMRQLQVREQSNEWMDKNRQKYMEERERQIQKITETLTQVAQQKAVRDIEIMEKMHDLCSAQVGAAHRAAADLPDFELLKSQENRENLEKAKIRGTEALAQERSSAEKAKLAAEKMKTLRENLRREEDVRLKEYVARSGYMTRNQRAVDRIVDRLVGKKKQSKTGQEYQPSLARTLRVPKDSASEAKISKSLKTKRLSRKPKDVTYYDLSIPQGTIKYPPPPGLVQKHPKVAGNAFEAAKLVSSEQKKQETRKNQEELQKARLAETRGKRALKVAKLQRQLDDIQNEFLESGFHVDPKLNDSFLGLSDSSNSGDARSEDLMREDHAVSHEGVQTSPQYQQTSVRLLSRKGDAATSRQNYITGIPKSPTKERGTETRLTPKTPITPPRSTLSPVPPKSPLVEQKFPQGVVTQSVDKSDKYVSSGTSQLQRIQTPPSGSPPSSNQVKASKDTDNQATTQRMNGSVAETLGSKRKISEKTETTELSVHPSDRPSSQEVQTTDYRPEVQLPFQDIGTDGRSIGQVDTAVVTPSRLQGDGYENTVGVQPSQIQDSEVTDAYLAQDNQKVARDSIINDIERPRLISTKKSVRLQLDQGPAARRSEELSRLTSQEQGLPRMRNGRKSPPDLLASKLKDITAKPPLLDDQKYNRVTDKESSSSLHTLSSIGSSEDLSEKQLTDHRSPPDSSQRFPLTSTPSLRDKLDTSLDLSSRNNSGPYTPRTAVKRKKALQYYIKKLLEMRPESMATLEAISSVNFKNSYIEIPTSAVTSIVGSETSTDASSLSDLEIVNESENTNNSRNSKSYIGTMNGTSDYYTTLSSVTEEEEEADSELSRNGHYRSDNYDSTNGSSGGTDTLNHVSSGDTIAKVTVSVSPRSSS